MGKLRINDCLNGEWKKINIIEKRKTYAANKKQSAS